MFALGLFAFVVAISTAVFRTRHEVVDALIASATVSLVIAIAIERDVVMNRFVPGVGDSVPLRLVLPLVVGFAIGAGVHSVKRLLAKPTEVASR